MNINGAISKNFLNKIEFFQSEGIRFNKPKSKRDLTQEEKDLIKNSTLYGGPIGYILSKVKVKNKIRKEKKHSGSVFIKKSGN